MSGEDVTRQEGKTQRGSAREMYYWHEDKCNSKTGRLGEGSPRTDLNFIDRHEVKDHKSKDRTEIERPEEGDEGRDAMISPLGSPREEPHRGQRRIHTSRKPRSGSGGGKKRR